MHHKRYACMEEVPLGPARSQPLRLESLPTPRACVGPQKQPHAAHALPSRIACPQRLHRLVIRRTRPSDRWYTTTTPRPMVSVAQNAKLTHRLVHLAQLGISFISVVRQYIVDVSGSRVLVPSPLFLCFLSFSGLNNTTTNVNSVAWSPV
jgi:hypothetical protein